MAELRRLAAHLQGMSGANTGANEGDEPQVIEARAVD